MIKKQKKKGVDDTKNKDLGYKGFIENETYKSNVELLKSYNIEVVERDKYIFFKQDDIELLCCALRCGNRGYDIEFIDTDNKLKRVDLLSCNSDCFYYLTIKTLLNNHKISKLRENYMLLEGTDMIIGFVDTLKKWFIQSDEAITTGYTDIVYLENKDKQVNFMGVDIV